MADPYRYLPPEIQALTPTARFPLYNGGPWNASTNPCGLGENGHIYVLEAFEADLASLILEGHTILSLFTTFLAGESGWTSVDRVASRMGADTLALAGADISGEFSAGRAISLIQGLASGFGYVVSSSYDAANTRTLVTVEGVAVDAGITEVRLGQDPRNAPKAQSAKALAIIFG